MVEDPKPTELQQTERRHGAFWLVFVIGLLGGQVVLLSIMSYLAASDRSFSIEPDYYRKGLNWDATAAQLRQNERLGWSVRIDLGDTLGVLGEREVTCKLVDRKGVPLDGASLKLVAFPHARGSERVSVELAAAGNGSYKRSMRFRRKGLWEFRLAVARGPEMFTHTELRDVYPPGESRPWQP
jgi:nitrogen fixation protein FixH